MSFHKWYEIRDRVNGESVLLGRVFAIWSEVRPYVWEAQVRRWPHPDNILLRVSQMPSGRKRGQRWHWWIDDAGRPGSKKPYASFGFKTLTDCRLAGIRAAFNLTEEAHNVPQAAGISDPEDAAGLPR